MNISKQNSKTVVINIFSNFSKKEIPLLSLAIRFKKNVKNLEIIGTNAYYIVCQLNKTQVFNISKKFLKFQAKKKARPETYLKTVKPEKY